MNRETSPLDPWIIGAGRIAVAGHRHPDGDCFGSATALFAYIKTWFPEKETTLFLEPVKTAFSFMPFYGTACDSYADGSTFDLLLLTDVSSMDRIGVSETLFRAASKTVVIDHHISNPGFGEENFIVPEASSACEVLYDLLPEKRVTFEMAALLYLGIVHDTGLFTYQSTSPHTLRIAAELLEKGIDHTRIIDETFQARSYAETRILGLALEKSRLFTDGRLIVSWVSAEEMDACGAGKQDLDGIVSNLRMESSCEGAIFVYPAFDGTGHPETGRFKVSLRSKSFLDVCKIAQHFDGGGHLRAAGCTVAARDAEDALQMVLQTAEHAFVG